ncbi:ADP-ribosylglycohydrolase family protein [Hoylesella oralis]|uniref:ADP-ribosylglycohydrolase family protein n=1 Tax=Hoylesella oralis TaxID=28134 RepID=UPI0028EF39C2|nr:ADP-ribosylglycohydrolase family protein [Hoylesella oralis]
MLGAIIGDIIGSRFEFDETPQEGFQLFTTSDDYTDDTICTIAIADAILNKRNYQEALLDWCHRYPRPKGCYGGMFEKWLLSDNPLPQSSYGNGSAMRVSAVGWLFNDYHEVMEEAKKSAEVSHCHREGIKGAQCVATLIYWLRTCRITKDEVENTVKRSFGYDIPSLQDIYKIGDEGHFDSTCMETVPWAIRCFLESESFEDAIRIAVMAKGDTDTKAAICGSIAEAYYEIPETFIEKTYGYLPDDMLNIIEQFYEHIRNDITG